MIACCPVSLYFSLPLSSRHQLDLPVIHSHAPLRLPTTPAPSLAPAKAQPMKPDVKIMGIRCGIELGVDWALQA